MLPGAMATGASDEEEVGLRAVDKLRVRKEAFSAKG